MTQIEFLAAQIKSRFGTIKRARGNFLYTQKRIRLTDMFLEGGRAVLGWGSDRCSAWTVFKNIISRGVTGSYFTDFNVRSKAGGKTPLERAVSSLLNSDRKVFVFNSKENALKAAISVSPDSTSVYRPWNVQMSDWTAPDCVIIAPPLAWAGEIWLCAVKEDLFIDSDFSGTLKAFLPAPLEASVVRSIYDLIKALQDRSEKDWFLYDKVLVKYFKRTGPWLFPKVPEEKYSDFVKHCLDCNLVISPVYSVPSFVPYKADYGVFRLLEKTPFEY